MITSANLITFGMASIEEYYSEAVTNLSNGKTVLARNQFKALSKRQQKDFFFHVSKDWEITAGHYLYDFFFEML